VHTTNRIDVELGARLFRHLLALPMAYFQARHVGDSVARVRELEKIRNFLTSSAPTLVIDLFFTVVFLAVMFFYSPLLTWIVLGSFPFYMAARGISVTHETIRQWGLKFGREFANRIRRRAPRRGDKWHLDEVVISFARKKHWLWRAVDQDGFVLDVLVQSRRDK
jgi:ABC-type multidrug transport system fused ATPase/permease subunit